MALRTPLYDWHAAHGARLVEFAGWDMPIQYRSITDEHTAVRTAAGLFDVSHMGRLSFAGADALEFLQFILTNNVATLKDFQARYSLICNEHGGIRDDVLVYRWPYGYAVVVNASNRDKIVAWLNQHKGARNVQVIDQTLDTCMFAVQGPRAIELCRSLVDTEVDQLGYYFAAATRCMGQQCVVSRTGYTGEDGLEFMIGKAHGVALWEELVRRGAQPCGLGARDTLRLEAAMPLYGHELTEEIDPFQAGVGWAVKFDKGEFLGRDALQRRQMDVTLRRRVGLELEGKRIARESAAVLRDGVEVGRVTSGTFAPTLNKAIAMALVEPACTPADTLLQVDVRGKPEPARVVPLPFYRRAKK